jgi:hypothetical protein
LYPPFLEEKDDVVPDLTEGIQQHQGQDIRVRVVADLHVDLSTAGRPSDLKDPGLARQASK